MRIKSLKIAGMTLATLCLTTQALSGVEVILASEMEPNNSLLTPQVFSPFPLGVGGDLGSLQVQASLSPGDVDFFQVQFLQDVNLSVYATPSLSGGPSSLIGMFHADGTQVITGPMLGPMDVQEGIYVFSVTGLGDIDFTGNHAQSHDYLFQLNWFVIPAPCGLAAFAAAGLLGRSRRR